MQQETASNGADPHDGLLSRWDLLLGFWTLYGLIHVVSSVVVRLLDGRPLDDAEIAWRMVAWYTWVPATMLILRLARRFPFDRGRWMRALPVHLLGAVGASLFTALLFRLLRYGAALLAGQPYDLPLEMRQAVLRYLVYDTTLYFSILAVAHAFAYHRRYRAREVQASALKAALMEAQLQALKMQLHPHFFFNALHTISMLVRQRQEEEAVEVIAGLGALFRYILDHTETQVVCLQQELDFVRSYLAIEQVRFKDRLAVTFDVEPKALQAEVPVLLLQPLVENALRHGLEPVARPGRLFVRARREGGRLCLQVADDGQGLGPGRLPEGRQGIGLSNTRARLERLYGAAYRLALEPAPEGGAVVTLSFPYHLPAPP